MLQGTGEGESGERSFGGWMSGRSVRSGQRMERPEMGRVIEGVGDGVGDEEGDRAPWE